MSSHSPIPLGGTSNHIRRTVFDDIGAWDPYNVTEDADLGVRIAESGYRTAVLDSTTLEEANSDPINWVRQRSRWYKGYLQTWLVHMRRPVRLWRAIGTVGMLRFTTLLAGTPIIACLNMVFWLTTVSWLLGHSHHRGDLPGVRVLSGSDIAGVRQCRRALHESDRMPGNIEFGVVVAVPDGADLLAAHVDRSHQGTYQLIRNPSYWEKTFHGLTS